MSLAQLKEQVAQLPVKEQRELIAFLVALQTETDEEFKQELAAKIDNHDSARWVDLDNLQKKYAE